MGLITMTWEDFRHQLNSFQNNPMRLRKGKQEEKLCGSECSSLLQTKPKFQVRYMENKKL